jgi:ribonuclease-3
MDEDRIAACESAIGYTFAERTLLERALTHSSVKSPDQPSNERLEFLGDAVLGAVVSEYLFRTFEEFTEGQLTKVKSVVVSSRTLGRCTRRLGLDRCLAVGKGIAVQRSLPLSILGNAFEAIVAAVFLDGGMEAARGFVLRELEAEVDKVLANRHPRNHKSLLQHLVQKRYATVPSYRVLEERGPDHAKEFRVCAVVGDRELGAAWGRSKREAEQIAAREAHRILRGEGGGTAAAAPEEGGSDS